MSGKVDSMSPGEVLHACAAYMIQQAQMFHIGLEEDEEINAIAEELEIGYGEGDPLATELAKSIRFIWEKDQP